MNDICFIIYMLALIYNFCSTPCGVEYVYINSLEYMYVPVLVHVLSNLLYAVTTYYVDS